MTTDVNTYLKPLIGSDNGLDIDELKRLIDSSLVAREELDEVMADDMLQSVDQYLSGEMTATTIVAGEDWLRGDTGRTEVYFWGVPGAGKTTVIGSLVAAQPESIEDLNTNRAVVRARSMKYALAESGCCTLLPQVERNEDGHNEVINLDVRDSANRLLPLSLIEMGSLNANHDILRQTTNDKIHMLCYDCTQAGAEQDRALMALLDRLKEDGHMERAVGVYLLVTKTDTFVGYNAPISYRDELAQSLITSEHCDLWIRVRNLCIEMKIMDATPIPYYIGAVKLRRMIRIGLSDARQLIDRPIALKSHPYRSVVGRTLMWGKWQLTMVLLMLACGATIYAMYKAVPGVGAMPTMEIEPLDYPALFKAMEAERVKGKNCTDCDAAFAQLERDLHTEDGILLANGRRVMLHRQAHELYSILYGDYAESVIGGLRYETGGNWNEKYMKTLRSAANDLLYIQKRRYLSESKRQALKDEVTLVDEYFEAREVIEKSENCTSDYDVERIREDVERLLQGRLGDYQSIVEKLKGAVQKAEESYEEYRERQRGFSLRDLLEEMFN